MYVQCYDVNGQRHNFNVIGDNSQIGMARIKRHVERKGYTRVTIVPFMFLQRDK